MFSGIHGTLQIPKNIQHDVHFTGHLSIDDLASVMGSALILTFVPYFEGFGIPLVEAMRCGTPILAGNRTSLPEVAGDAAIYCDPFSEDDIFQQMSLLVNDEILRNELSAKGLQRSRLFSWDMASAKVWEVLESHMHKS